MNVLREPAAPTIEAVLVASFIFTTPELVSVPVIVRVEAAVAAVISNSPVALTVVVPVTVMFFELVLSIAFALIVRLPEMALPLVKSPSKLYVVAPAGVRVKLL